MQLVDPLPAYALACAAALNVPDAYLRRWEARDKPDEATAKNIQWLKALPINDGELPEPEQQQGSLLFPSLALGL